MALYYLVKLVAILCFTINSIEKSGYVILSLKSLVLFLVNACYIAQMGSFKLTQRFVFQILFHFVFTTDSHFNYKLQILIF